MKVNFVVHPAHGRAFTADATYFPDGQPKPVVIFTHGFKGFKDWGHFNLLARYFADRGFVFVKFNFSHNGATVEDDSDVHDLEAFGQNNFSLELDDLKALIDLLHIPTNSPVSAQEIDITRLYLIGHSRGGGAVILKAAEDPRVKAVATWAAVSDYDQRWPADVMAQWQREGVRWIPNVRTGKQMPLYYQLVEDFELNRARLDIPKVLPNMQQPLLILHGAQDETVPLQMAQALKNGKPDAEFHLLPQGDHSFGGQHPYEPEQLPDTARTAADLSIDFFCGHA